MAELRGIPHRPRARVVFRLESRRVALNPTPRGVGIVRALVASDGGDPDAVVLVDAGSRELDPADDFGGIADATFGSYWAWDNLLTTLPADQERVWRVDDALGLHYHSYLLGVHEQSRDAEPALWEDVHAITAEGFALAAENPDEAADVFDRITPYFPRLIVERSLELIAPTWFHDEEWGVVRRELVEPYAQWLAGLGILERPGEWASAFRVPDDDEELAS
ncbi:MAG: ABC transporter substrate-binding protein [Microbacteriaceae bacterium]|nr:ABC transporter substrate-binding protein [Microbacteriaceae bacterium]